MGRKPTGEILSSAKSAAFKPAAQVATATSPTLQQRLAVVPPIRPAAKGARHSSAASDIAIGRVSAIMLPSYPPSRGYWKPIRFRMADTTTM